MDVLVFDGDCGFCTSTANYFGSRTRSEIKAVAWQLTDLASLGLTAEETAKRVYFIQSGKTYAAEKAIAKLLVAQKNFLYRLVGFAIQIPPFSWLAKPGYFLVARFRHRLPGGTPACKMQ